MRQKCIIWIYVEIPDSRLHLWWYISPWLHSSLTANDDYNAFFIAIYRALKPYSERELQHDHSNLFLSPHFCKQSRNEVVDLIMLQHLGTLKYNLFFLALTFLSLNMLNLILLSAVCCHSLTVSFIITYSWYTTWHDNSKLSYMLLKSLCWSTVYPKKYAHGFCFAVLPCGYTLTDFPISIRLTSLALWQSNDCPSASKATLMNMDKHFMWIHYEQLHNHNKAKHNKTMCIFLGIYCNLICVDIC